MKHALSQRGSTAGGVPGIPGRMPSDASGAAGGLPANATVADREHGRASHQWHPAASPPVIFMTIAAILVAVLHLGGCSAAWLRGEGPQRDRTAPDFALAFNVGGDAAAEDPLHQPAHYVLDAGRRFRAAIGPDATADYVPPPLRRIEPADVDALWRTAYDAGLLERPDPAPAASAAQTEGAHDPSDDPAATAPTRYRITLTAYGRRYDHHTSPQANPGTDHLLSMLIQLGQGRPATPDADGVRSPQDHPSIPRP